MASTVASIKVVKSFTYRGSTKLWSNRYHLHGGTPPDSTHWTTLSDAIVTAEKAMLFVGVTIVETLGYAAGSEVPVFTKTYSTGGTLSTTGLAQSAGDSALLVRYSTASRTSKNHPLYLFNYYHGVYTATTDGDTVAGIMRTAAATYATSWVSPGFSDGSTSYTRAGPRGDQATGQLVETATHHRDFPT